MDMLLGRGPRPSEPKEPPKPAPPQEQVEPEPEDMYPKPMDVDYFSSAGTAALLFWWRGAQCLQDTVGYQSVTSLLPVCYQSVAGLGILCGYGQSYENAFSQCV